MRWAIIFAILLVAVVPVSALADITGTASVIDGDTIDVAGRRIYLHGIDAPESTQRCRRSNGQMWPCGEAAADLLRELTEGSNVTCEPLGRDGYQR